MSKQQTVLFLTTFFLITFVLLAVTLAGYSETIGVTSDDSESFNSVAAP